MRAANFVDAGAERCAGSSLNPYVGIISLAFLFFQAEDGIRAVAVTGVQTCALPICFAWPVGAAAAVYVSVKIAAKNAASAASWYGEKSRTFMRAPQMSTRRILRATSSEAIQNPTATAVIRYPTNDCWRGSKYPS